MCTLTTHQSKQPCATILMDCKHVDKPGQRSEPANSANTHSGASHNCYKVCQLTHLPLKADWRWVLQDAFYGQQCYVRLFEVVLSSNPKVLVYGWYSLYFYQPKFIPHAFRVVLWEIPRTRTIICAHWFPWRPLPSAVLWIALGTALSTLSEASLAASVALWTRCLRLWRVKY